MTTTPAPRHAGATAAPSRQSAELWYLGFLSILVVQPAFDPAAGAVEWVVTGAAVLAFVPLYVAVHARPGPLRRLGAPLSVLLAVAVFWFNGGATVLLIYAASFVGFYEPRRTAMRWFVGLSLLVVAMGVMAPLPLPFALAVFAVPVVFIWLVGMSAIEEAEREREAQRLRVDNARIGQLATAAERERIARDLHDVLGQSLTEIIVRAQLARRLVGADGERAVTAETALALVVREAVTNVIRHADAARCAIVLRREGSTDVIEVTDDGHGGIEEESSGLLGMRERVLALGGELTITDSDGVSVRVRVPAGVPA